MITTDVVRPSNKVELSKHIWRQLSAVVEYGGQTERPIRTIRHDFPVNAETSAPDYVRSFLKAARQEGIKFRFWGAVVAPDQADRIQCMVTVTNRAQHKNFRSFLKNWPSVPLRAEEYSFD